LAPVLRVKATSVESVPAARDALLDWMAERFPTDRAKLDLSVGLERLENTKQAILLTKLIFGFLIALMLAIGGIGIMNVLLASIAERTREIGIRKAVGASRRDILWHFLSESVAIATMGSVVGVVLGVALSAGASAVFRRLAGAEIYPVFSAGMFFLAASSALAVGLIFGTYPARIASRLTPIQAIQRD
jgi:putative ABC transport system permease protein